MCGIFVYIGSRYTIERLKPHFEKIKHRGPEFSKIINICPGVVFGFHRLAIIDSSELGNQPIFHPDDPAQVIVVNGEIYNYKTLKQVYDYHTRSGSDSDTMLHLYHHFGVEAMLRELDGVYAFVIRDHDKIIAGNDIIGVRPLFVAYLPDNELAFCSEEKGLIGLNPIRIERFKPGTFVVHDIKDKTVTSEIGLNYEPFFDWYHGPDRLDLASLKYADEKTVCSTVEEYLIQAVKKRLVSDRPIGCLLSGGLDSSLVTSIASRYYVGAKATATTMDRENCSSSTATGVHHSTTCSLYGGNNTNGGKERLKMAVEAGEGVVPSGHDDSSVSSLEKRRDSSPYLYKDTHHTYENDDTVDDTDITTVSPTLLMPDSTKNNGAYSLQHNNNTTTCDCASQPHLSMLHTFSVGMRSDKPDSRSPDLEYAELVAKKLGTKHHRVEFTFEDAFLALKEVIWCLGSSDCTTVRASVGQFLLAKYVRERTDVKVLMSGEGAEETFGSYSYLKRAPGPEAFEEEVIDLCRNLYQFDALRSDRTLAYWGLELREPFLDKKLFPYVLFRVPARMKMHGDYRMEKYILRQAFSYGDYLPKEVLWRKKEAFSDGVNYEYRDRLIAKIDSLVSDDTFATEAPRMPCPVPLTKEAFYYRKLYDKLFGIPPLVTKNWMPKAEWFPPEERASLVDPSARVLSTYDIDPKDVVKVSAKNPAPDHHRYSITQENGKIL